MGVERAVLPPLDSNHKKQQTKTNKKRKKKARVRALQAGVQLQARRVRAGVVRHRRRRQRRGTVPRLCRHAADAQVLRRPQALQAPAVPGKPFCVFVCVFLFFCVCVCVWRGGGWVCVWGGAAHTRSHPDNPTQQKKTKHTTPNTAASLAARDELRRQVLPDQAARVERVPPGRRTRASCLSPPPHSFAHVRTPSH